MKENQMKISDLQNIMVEIKVPMRVQEQNGGQRKESVNWKIEQQKLSNLSNKQKKQAEKKKIN